MTCTGMTDLLENNLRSVPFIRSVLLSLHKLLMKDKKEIYVGFPDQDTYIYYTENNTMERWTPNLEVLGSIPTRVTVLCP